jgi:hypothetical protein
MTWQNKLDETSAPFFIVSFVAIILAITLVLTIASCVAESASLARSNAELEFYKGTAK